MSAIETTAPTTLEAPVATSAAAELALARTDTVAVSEADYAESLRMAEEIGKVKMAQAISSGLSLSVIRWFAAMKESGSYKRAPIMNFRGELFRPKTFEELCEGMGFSRSTVHDSRSPSSISPSVFPTPAKTMSSALKPALMAAAISPPLTVSAPNPASLIRRSIAGLALAFIA